MLLQSTKRENMRFQGYHSLSQCHQLLSIIVISPSHSMFPRHITALIISPSLLTLLSLLTLFTQPWTLIPISMFLVKKKVRKNKLSGPCQNIENIESHFQHKKIATCRNKIDKKIRKDWLKYLRNVSGLSPTLFIWKICPKTSKTSENPYSINTGLKIFRSLLSQWENGFPQTAKIFSIKWQPRKTW